MTKRFHTCDKCNKRVYESCTCMDFITETWGLCHSCLKSNVKIKNTKNITCDDC